MKLDLEMRDLPVSTPETYPSPVERRKTLVPLFAEGAVATPVPPGLEIINRTVPGPKGAPDVPVRIYRPKSDTPLPVLLYAHGGAFVIGNLDSEHARCIQLADGAKCIVVSVDYRLAPEHPFPAAFDDGYAVLEWIWAEGKAQGCDLKRIAVGGLSAGGSIAAAVVLASRDRKGPPICFQLLCIPVLDDRLETPSARTCTDVPIFCRFQAQQMWEAYLGTATGPTSPYAAPARASTLRDLPPTYVLAAGFDPLRDEAIQYAARMMADGVDVELHVIPGVPHGFDLILPSVPKSVRAIAEVQNALRTAFAGG